MNDISRSQNKLEKAKIEHQLNIKQGLLSTNPVYRQKATAAFNQYKDSRVNELKREVKAKKGEPKALMVDPFDEQNGLGYYNKKRDAISFDLLRAASHVPIIRAIINTRKEQICEYLVPQANRFGKGFVFKKNNTPILENRMQDPFTDQDKREIDLLTKYLLNCGSQNPQVDNNDFESWGRRVIEDSLVLDQGVFETMWTADFKQPLGFMALDGATIRTALSYFENKKADYTLNGYLPSHVQVYQEQICAEFYPWEIGVMQRNPQTDIMRNGYGMSELEDIIQTITSIVNADTYNSNIFKQGSMIKGLLFLDADEGIDEIVLQEFKNEWNATVSGVENSHKTPVMPHKGNFVDLMKNNRDMEFSNFQNYLVKLCCAVYKISPEEIGFPVAGSYNANGARGNRDQEYLYSNVKGVRPVLRTLERIINRHIIEPLTNGKYRFSFVGVDPESELEEDERLTKAVNSYMTVNEVRKIKGLDPISGGDILLNPVFANAIQQQMMGDPESDDAVSKLDSILGDPVSVGDDEKAEKAELVNPMLEDLKNFTQQAFVKSV